MKTKQSPSRMPNRTKGLNFFAGDTLEAFDTLIGRALECIHEIKNIYHGQTISFE